MPDIGSNFWTENDTTNSNASPNGAPEGMPAGKLNDVIRMMMGANKRSWNRINGTETSTGSSSEYLLTYDVTPGALIEGEIYTFKANHTSSAAATLNINALGAKSIKRRDGSNTTGGEIVSGNYYSVLYDGTNFRIHNSMNSVVGDFTVTSALYTRTIGIGSTNVEDTSRGYIFVSGNASRTLVDLYSASAHSRMITLRAGEVATSALRTQIGISANAAGYYGVKIASQQTTDFKSTGTNTVSIPKRLTINDATTIYNVGGDARIASSNDQDTICITAGGLVGIGTMNPNNLFHVQTASNLLTAYIKNGSSVLSNPILRIDASRGNSTAGDFIRCRNNVDVTPDTQFYVRLDGQVYSDASFNGGGADDGELFEFIGELVVGDTVVMDNGVVRRAVEGEVPFGVVRPNDSPNVNIGNNPLRWPSKYLMDDYGSYIKDRNGKQKLNPAYNPNLKYIPRIERPDEWKVIAWWGQIPVNKSAVKNPNWIYKETLSNTVDIYVLGV